MCELQRALFCRALSGESGHAGRADRGGAGAGRSGRAARTAGVEGQDSVFCRDQQGAVQTEGAAGGRADARDEDYEG